MPGLRAALVLLLISPLARAGEVAPVTASARARQLAAILEMKPMIDRLLDASAPPGASEAGDLEPLRRQALDQLGSTSLLVERTLMSLQREQFESSGVHDYLAERHEGSTTAFSIAALLIGNGVGIVGSALQFDGVTQGMVGDGLIIAGALISTALGIVALARHGRAAPPYPIETNFLARLLGRAPPPDGGLPEPVWRYLDTPFAGEVGSARSQLVEKWEREGRISFAPSVKDRRRLALLSSPISRRDSIADDVLDDRAGMLADLYSRVAAMRVDVETLIRDLRGRGDAPVDHSEKQR